MDMTKRMKNGRRGGRSRGGGRGRGRDRGRKPSSFNSAIPLVTIDDDDEVCNMALAQAELENNSMITAFDELNASSQLDGFDSMSGAIYIYPTNRPVRDYQFKIVQTALFNNTLVSLPTGLGKTFISAVVMYNFQRWYPNGIIVFMAPTKPLVTQQLDACHHTVGISPKKTVELTGNLAPKRRVQLWKSKTVFFLTPQVMLSDLERNYFAPENVRCIVVDEAHKALGNHAYTQVIAKIAEKSRLFRVLALSATPGSDLLAVQQVFKNLLISRVELRSEDSEDVLPYTHDKKVEPIVVPLDNNLKSAHSDLIEVYQTYTGNLMKAGALSGRNSSSFTKFQLLKAREAFRQGKGKKLPSHQKGYIEIDFATCMSLAHALELLLSHGLRTFYSYMRGVVNKERGTTTTSIALARNAPLLRLLDEIKNRLHITDESLTFNASASLDQSASALFTTVDSAMMNRTSSSSFGSSEDMDVPVDYTASHPKLKILKDIVYQHFLDYQTKNDTTRAMIFSQYRDSVQEIGRILHSLRPMVKPMVFVGQANTSAVGKGLNQKAQVEVMQKFRDGRVNVLICTSVGEEGLDIGEVDLIICFDTNKSPVRLIQRMGRTGRQRDGRTVFLLTEGKEERSYTSSISSLSSINRNITNPAKLEPYLYKRSPRMVPKGLEPTCYKMSIILSSELETPSADPVLSDEGTESAFPAKRKRNSNDEKKKGKKKKKENPKTKTTANSDKIPSQTIVSMFEKISSGEKARNTPSASQDSRKESPSAKGIHHEVYDVEDDLPEIMIDTPPIISNAFSDKFSLMPSVFDIKEEGSWEWKPCVSFAKSKEVDATALSTLKESEGFIELDDILGEEEMLRIDRALKTLSSFSDVNREHCECGNYLEKPHQHLGDYGTSLEERKEDADVSLEEFTDYNPEGILTPPAPLPPKTPSKGSCHSSDEGKSVFSKSPSPEPSTSSYKAKFAERLNAKIVFDQGVPLVSDSDSTNFNESEQRASESPKCVALPEIQCSSGSSTTASESKRKFVFKKKIVLIESEKNSNNTLQKLNRPEQGQIEKNTFVQLEAEALASANDSKCNEPGETDDRLLFKESVSDKKDETFRKIFTFNQTTLEVGERKSLHMRTPGKLDRTKSKVDTFFNFETEAGSDDSELEETWETDDRLILEDSVVDKKDKTSGKKLTFNQKTKGEEERKSLQIRTPGKLDRTMSKVGTFTHFQTEASSDDSELGERSSDTGLDSYDDDFVEAQGNRLERKKKVTEHRDKSRNALQMRTIEKQGYARNKMNPFIDLEAEVSGDDSDLEEGYEYDGLENSTFDDSFVETENESSVTATQHGRYLKSVKDIVPARFGRVEKPLSPKNEVRQYSATDLDTTGEGYDLDDSFCQEEVEYLDVGVFTQAMNKAKVDLAVASTSAAGRRITRRAMKEKEGMMKKNSGSAQKGGKPLRRRVVTIDTSSDED